MDQYAETFNTWNKIASLYQKKFMDLDLYNDTYDAFCAQVTIRNASVLEIGCGPGNITRYLLQKRPDFNIEAIDVAPNMIKLAQQNNPGATFNVMDTRALDSIERTFDAIMIGFCLPYLSKSDVKKLLKDCAAILVPEGLIYMSFVGGDYQDSTFQEGSSGDRTYFYYHALQDIKVDLLTNKFTIVKQMDKRYAKSDGTEEVHTILLAHR